MTTDYRAMCVELVDKLSGYASANPHHDSDELVARARALLDQPEPPELTRDELQQMLFDNHRGAIEFLKQKRQVLNRFVKQKGPVVDLEAMVFRDKCGEAHDLPPVDK